MAVGNQPSVGSINNGLTQLALAWRDLASQTLQQWQYLNSLGAPGLETVGFDAPDAAAVISMINYLVVPAQVYNGTQGQAPSGQTAADFDFENAVLPLWGGQ
jgi:hypothetical protein